MTKLKLGPEQIEDAMLMANSYDLPNFSKPGTGKTHTTLEAIRLSALDRGLILCPKIALDWWYEQTTDYLGAECNVVRTGSKKLTGDIMIMTYGIARNRRAELYDYYGRGPLGFLVNDESHNLCSPDTKQTKAVFGNDLDLRGGLAENFEQVWNLTGTPQVNYANDMYTQSAVLHKDNFEKHGIKSFADFERMFCYKQQRKYNPRMQPVWKVVGNQHELLLRRIIYDEIGAIRRLETPGLPSLRERTLQVTFTPGDEVRRAFKEIRGLNDAEVVRKLNDPDGIMAKAWRLTGLGKVEEVLPYIGDCAKEGPVLVGCWHRDVIQAYADALQQDFKISVVHGGTSDTQRVNIRKAFNDGFTDVLIGQMAAMGTSWNLQEASRHVIIAEEHPTPSIIEQFYKRVYRRGQKNACQLDFIHAKDNKIDEALAGIRNNKATSNKKVNG